jgi:2-keto-4-pentenoate hydratase/2-oxohepta-3-ene-1,7-dioic acid hydratase in catechol pathway
MRLLTFEAAGRSRLGAEWEGRVVDLQNVAALSALIRYGAAGVQEVVERFPSDMLGYLRGGATTRGIARETLDFLAQLPEDVVQNLAGNSALIYREDQIRRRAPVPQPGKIICLGLNYRDHAAESGMAVPTEPVLFCKYSNAVAGPEDPIVLPATSDQVDYEAELVFVIGKAGRNIPAAEAMTYVAGYTCGHDVSARDYQLKRGGGQWMVGKTWDTFAPMGPVLVTADERIDPHDLPIRCVLNGEVMQNSSTAQFVFNIPETIAYLSHVMTLEAGDVVFTGTPPGVGFARKPPIFLKEGDVVEIQIDGIGVLRNPVRSARRE